MGNKERYFPNFIQKREGNEIHFLTEVVGGTIFRRTVTLSDDTDIEKERETFFWEADKEILKILREQIDTYDANYDGKLYTLEDMPVGVDILDVMSEIRRDAEFQSEKEVTHDQVEVAIFRALRRKKEKK